MKKNFPIVTCIAGFLTRTYSKSVCVLLCVAAGMIFPLSIQSSPIKAHFFSLFGVKEKLALTKVGYLETGLVPVLRFEDEAKSKVNRLALIPLMEIDTVFESGPMVMEKIITSDPEITEEIPVSVILEPVSEKKEELSPEDILMLFKRQIDTTNEVDVPFILPTEGQVVDPNSVRRVKSRYSVEP